MEKQFLIYELKKILGPYTPKSKGNYAFNCPFCNHHKQKLEIKIESETKGENPWECWVCKTRGKTIKSLLTTIQKKTSIIITTETFKSILGYIPSETAEFESDETLELPPGFKPLYEHDSNSINARIALDYLHKRRVTLEDIVKYNIGISTNPKYYDRIIIPSYDQDNNLNYIITRSIHPTTRPKYLFPSTNRNVVVFENLINWEVPVILVEGVFDAFSVKRNAIPLLGTTMLTAVKRKIVISPVTDVYIALDPDAQHLALKIAEELRHYDKRVFIVSGREDPGDLGFVRVNSMLRESNELDLRTLMEYKLR